MANTNWAAAARYRVRPCGFVGLRLHNIECSRLALCQGESRGKLDSDLAWLPSTTGGEASVGSRLEFAGHTGIGLQPSTKRQSSLTVARRYRQLQLAQNRLGARVRIGTLSESRECLLGTGQITICQRFVHALPGRGLGLLLAPTTGHPGRFAEPLGTTGRGRRACLGGGLGRDCFPASGCTTLGGCL